jgi:gas vesicle protein
LPGAAFFNVRDYVEYNPKYADLSVIGDCRRRTSRSNCMKKLLITLFALAALAACDNKGPAESAGEALDDAASSMQDAATEAGESMQQAADDASASMEAAADDMADSMDEAVDETADAISEAGDSMEEAASEMGEKVEEACEDVTGADC